MEEASVFSWSKPGFMARHCKFLGGQRFCISRGGWYIQVQPAAMHVLEQSNVQQNVQAMTMVVLHQMSFPSWLKKPMTLWCFVDKESDDIGISNQIMV